jgi:predicted O-methyltransferase YrrM
MSQLEAYLNEIRVYKERLFGLYTAAGAELRRKELPRAGGTSWGYRLESWGSYFGQARLTGTSIGEDEIRIFYDLCQLLRPRRSLVIGNGFGLSTIALGLALPENEVVSMDNWSEGEAGIAARDLSEQIVRNGDMVDRVCIYTGTSPQDIPAAMNPWLERGEQTLDLAFIDGMHTDDAAEADFKGLRPYFNRRSVVLWHNVHKTRLAFEEAAASADGRIWDRHCVLRTYGPLGIFYHAGEQPLLHRYLLDTTLIWNDWHRFLRALSRDESTPEITPGLGLTIRRRVRALIRGIRKW